MAAVAEEQPFAAVVSTDKLSDVCSTCFTMKSSSELQRCSRCRLLYYCGRECQQKDWSEHKFECPVFKRVHPRQPPSVARLMIRIMNRLQRKDEKSAFNGRTWASLMDHKAEIQRDPARSDFFISVSHVLYDMLGSEMIPPAAELLSIFGKIMVNCITITNESCQSLGEAIYLGLSAHNHSCDPDCFIIFDGPKAILRSRDSKKTYSEELTICYTDLMQTTAERREHLRTSYYFDCTCRLCNDESRDQWGRSVISSCCTDGVCLLDERLISLSCYNCGQMSKISIDEGITANQELRMHLNRTSDADLTVRLQADLSMYERMSKILSTWNFLMTDLAQRIFLLASELGNLSVVKAFSTITFPSYKRYLPIGHPELTFRVLNVAQQRSTEETATGAVLELLQEAQELALASHGPRHSFTSRIGLLVSNYRQRLQRETS